MGKARSDSGYYWVDRKLTCNGCKYLNCPLPAKIDRKKVKKTE